jgi:hypothetical protein
LGQSDGPLSQAFEAQIVEVALLDQFHRGFDAVSGETGSGTDAYACHGVAHS